MQSQVSLNHRAFRRVRSEFSPWAMRLIVWIISLFAGAIPCATVTSGAELTAARVLESIDAGREFLLTRQKQDGSFDAGNNLGHRSGVSALCTLALLNSGMEANQPQIRKALQYLRRLPEDEISQTYDISLVIMALVAAKDSSTNDLPRIARLASRLESWQIREGNSGSWTYSSPGGGINLGGDRSNAQYAVLGLREAAEAGVEIDRKTWERIRTHWTSQQNPDGGWNYSSDGQSTGSMTVAGVATLSIVEQMLVEDRKIGPDGSPPCCEPAEPNEALDRGLRWLANRFTPLQNPGSGTWLLYYLYGVERAGRLSGQRFFGQHDWYREGAEVLLKVQNQRTGAWVGVGLYESEPTVASAFALLFLSKGLAPVLVNKLKYGPPNPNRPGHTLTDDWNRHPRDARNLTEYLSGRPLWPKLLTAQEVDLSKAVAAKSVASLAQAPVLYITGQDALDLTDAEIALLKEYVEQGGFILGVAGCQSARFEESFRELTPRLFPPGEGVLKKLSFDHPVFRSEFLLDPEGLELWGVDAGCRTPVIFCPEDIGCLWHYWSRLESANRNPNLRAKVIRATQIGTNIIAYATGREPPNKLDSQELANLSSKTDRIERSFLQIARIQHSGQWDAAPAAVRNLLTALDQSAGIGTNPKIRHLPLSDTNLYRYPLVYMHGRSTFELSSAEIEGLRTYLSRGGVLLADACCGAKGFDESFRAAMKKAFPATPLTRIPVTHEVFSAKSGQDVTRIRRRVNSSLPGQAVKSQVLEGEPYLEAIEIDGRLAVIYSKYDISCALERQSTVSCEGYVPEDAVKLAINLVIHALSQEVPLPPELANPAP